MADDLEANIYEAMNTLDDTVQSKGADAVEPIIEVWLNEDDQDHPDFRETLAQGVIDAVRHATLIDSGKYTITIVQGGDAMLRFDWNTRSGHSAMFDQTVLQAIKNALAGDHG